MIGVAVVKASSSLILRTIIFVTDVVSLGARILHS